MKYISVSTKLNIAVITISIVSLLVGSIVLFWYASEIEKEVYTNTKTDLINKAQDKILSKMRVGITNAISIANDERISTALETKQRDLAIASLKDISYKMKKYTDFKNIKVHIHTKENTSFLRNWKLEKYGDDLSSFRASVVHVNKSKKPLTSFEPGREGLLLRALTPISDKNGVHLGSLEFIQGINSVVKELDKLGSGFLLLMDAQKGIFSNKDFSFNKDVKFKEYIISQKYINQDFLADAQMLDMHKLATNAYVMSEDYFYTRMLVEDFEGKKLGVILLGEPLKRVKSAVDGAETLIYMALGGILLLTLLISIVILVSLKKLVIHPLRDFEQSLLDFFLFLRGEKDYTQSIEIKTNDEFGVMSRSLQDNIAYSAKLHEEINDLNTHLEERVIEKTKKIRILLDNAGQGFLSFSCDMIIDDEYSKECIKLLEDDLAGKSIVEILFKDASKQKFFKKTVIETCSIESLTVQKTILSLLPQEIILHRRALKLEYKILENKKLMMIVTNITAQKKLQKKIKKEQEVLKMIVEIISQNDSFFDTKKEYEAFIYNYQSYINKAKTSLNNIGEIYRIVHTFKGAFSQLYMNDVVKFLHNLETKLSLMIQEGNHTNQMILSVLESTDFALNFDKDMQIIRSVLGDEFLDSDNFLTINCSDISKLQKKISTVFKAEKLETKASKEIIHEITNLSKQKLINLLKPYVSLVQQLASKLEKEVYALKIIGDNEVLVYDTYKPFIKSLVHVFRNSVDHGIEDAETRLLHNKDDIGTITCSFTKDNDRIQIIISDDGKGISKEAVVSKAIKAKIITAQEVEKLDENEIYQLIFEENFSTKEEVSEISGRGVGMNAVKVEIEKLGGYIEISSQENLGTTFTMNIPYFQEKF